MKKLLKRKFIFLPLLILTLSFASLGVYAQDSGDMFMTYEEYLQTYPEDTSYETYMRLNVGRSTNVADCRNHCNASCVALHLSWWDYYVTDHCWY